MARVQSLTPSMTGKEYIQTRTSNPCLGICGRASAYGTGGPGFDSRGRVIPKNL